MRNRLATALTLLVLVTSASAVYAETAQWRTVVFIENGAVIHRCGWLLDQKPKPPKHVPAEITNNNLKEYRTVMGSDGQRHKGWLLSRVYNPQVGPCQICGRNHAAPNPQGNAQLTVSNVPGHGQVSIQAAYPGAQVQAQANAGYDPNLVYQQGVAQGYYRQPPVQPQTQQQVQVNGQHYPAPQPNTTNVNVVGQQGDGNPLRMMFDGGIRNPQPSVVQLTDGRIFFQTGDVNINVHREEIVHQPPAPQPAPQVTVVNMPPPAPQYDYCGYHRNGMYWCSRGRRWYNYQDWMRFRCRS